MSSTASRFSSQMHNINAPHTGHRPHAQKVKKEPSQAKQWILLGLAVFFGISLLFFAARGGEQISGQELVELCRQVSKGLPAVLRRDGVAIHIGLNNGQSVIMAEGIPPKACVNAAWDLIKDGTVSVNGVAPQRVTAAKLAEICNERTVNVLAWTPAPAY